MYKSIVSGLSSENVLFFLLLYLPLTHIILLCGCSLFWQRILSLNRHCSVQLPGISSSLFYCLHYVSFRKCFVSSMYSIRQVILSHKNCYMKKRRFTSAAKILYVLFFCSRILCPQGIPQPKEKLKIISYI